MEAINNLCSAIVGIIALIGIPVSIVWLIVATVKKQSKAKPKKLLIGCVVGIVVFSAIGSAVWKKTDDYDEYLVEKEEQESREALEKAQKEQEEANKIENEETETQIVEKEEETEPQTVAYEEETETQVNDEENKEILFRDVPWGTSCAEVNDMFGDYSLMNIAGESYRTFSTDEIILGDYQGIDFEYGDINIVSTALNGEVEVAGYTTSGIKLFFAYTPVDGVLTKEEKDSAFYGARYEFETQNLKEMSSDLISKLSSLYGDPAKTTEKKDLYKNKYTYTYWYGANDTVLVLKTQNTENDISGVYEDEIQISYVWLKGDEMLQEASDLLKQEAIDKEAEAYGSDSTGGL